MYTRALDEVCITMRAQRLTLHQLNPASKLYADRYSPICLPYFAFIKDLTVTGNVSRISVV